MSNIKLPLLRKNNSIKFDVNKIRSQKFIKEALSLNHNDFKFNSFSYCLDLGAFYLIIDDYTNNEMLESRYSFTLEEFNEEYFLSDIKLLKDDEVIFCELAAVN